MQRKNLRSSQRIQGINLTLRTALDIAPEQEANNATTGDIYVSVYKAYSDQTGKFPHYLQEAINTSLYNLLQIQLQNC